MRHARNRIIVELRSAEAGARLTVDGDGIAAEHRMLVFERFTRLDAARDREPAAPASDSPW